MQEQSDTQLLRDYAELGHEAAFREIVSRHADVVYASALRQAGSPDLARDIAQSVFTDLARKAQSLAGTLTGDAALLGWLYRSTRFAALNQLRDDRRRHSRERLAMQQLDPASETAPEWERVQPVLDEAMAELSDEDREALLLRFFKDRDFRAIGAAFGISDDAAQKRVSRALERLRTSLTSRGVTTTAGTLSALLVAETLSFAPAGLAATLSTTALVGTTLATTATATATKAIAMTTLQKTIVTALAGAAVVIGTGLYVTQKLKRDSAPAGKGNLSVRLADDNGGTPVRVQGIGDELASFGQGDAQVPRTDFSQETAVGFEWRNAFLSSNAPPRLPREAVEKYLDGKGRDAASLLAAYHASGDTGYLTEAASNFPDNPKVQWTVLMSDLFPEERRKWLEMFKASSPENALANYLSAKDYLNGHYVGQLGDHRVFGDDNLSAKEFLKSGQAQTGISELLEATRKPSFKDYLAESRLDEEALNLGAGRSPIQAKLASRGWSQAGSPQVATLKAIGYDFEQFQKEYLNLGDTASAEHLTQIGLALAARLESGDTGKFAVNQLNGLGLEALLIRSWDQNMSYEFLGGKTPIARLAEIRQQRDEIKALFPAVQNLKLQMTEADSLSYLERAWQFGDVVAARWLLRNYGVNHPMGNR